ncbi:hypothetical protein, partial [Spiroplasma phoeniceum]
MLIDKNIEDEFWNNSSSMIIQGIILAILEDYEDKICKNNLTTEIEEILKKELFFNKFNMASVAAIASIKKVLVEWLNNRKNTSIAKITASQVLVDS